MKSTSKWLVFDIKGKRVKTVTLTRNDGRHFLQIDPFEKELKENGLYAHRHESFDDRPYWKGWTFKQKLENLGWEFEKDGSIINAEW